MRLARRWLSTAVAVSIAAVTLASVPAAALGADPAAAHSGDYAVTASLGGAATWSGPTQPVNLQAGVEYQYGGWFRGTGTVAINPQETVGYSNIVWQSVALTDTWTYVSGNFTVPTDTPAVFRVVDASDGDRTFWIDDLSLKLDGAELLADPGFEDANDPWSYPEHWTRAYAPAGGGTGPAPMVAHTGSYAVTATLTGQPTWSGVQQYVTLAAGTPYAFSGWLRGQGTVAFNVQDTSTPNWDNVIWQNVDLSGGWTYVAYPLTPTHDAPFSVRIVDASANPGNVFVDDLSLRAAGGDELLTDPGFEAGDDAWTLADGWTRVSGGAPDGSFTDDDFSLVSAQSANISVDTSQADKFEGDGARATRNTTDDAWLVWHSTVDLTNVSIPIYNWSDYPAAAVTLAASADGTTWRDLTTRHYTVVNTSAGEWPLTDNESSDFQPGDRFLRVTVSSGASGAPAWAVQIARLYANNRVQAVVASPDAGRIDGPVSVTLSTGTPGATIYYRVGTGNVQTYSGPITVSGGTVAVWASTPGYLPSVVRTLAYTSTADLTVDRYGQIIAADFPGKVTSDAQLRADVTGDEAYYGALTPPTDRDAHGGLAGSGSDLRLTTTGFYHVENQNGRSVLVSPEGNADFSLGLDGLGYVGDTYTQVTGREQLYEYLPTDPSDPLNGAWYQNGRDDYSFYVANLIRKYGSFDPQAYYQEMVQRAKDWGFNTAGAYSGDPSADPGFTNVDFLNMPSAPIAGTKLYDIYQPGLEAALDANFSAQLPARANDPSLLGYMTFNEIDYDKFRTAIPAAQASVVATKGALVDWLAEHYNGDIAAFNTAWGLSQASFDALREAAFSPTTDAAVSDMSEFFLVYLDRFYGLVAQVFHRYDTHHMLIGDRWLANVINDPTLRTALATEAGKYLDALSYNYYTYDLDTARIDEMYQDSGHKPLILTEFHYADTTQGLVTGVRFADNQVDKGLMYRNYVEKAAASGEVIGTHWFITLDQAPTGRWYEGYHGEAGGIGVLDVTDRPYKDLLAEMMTTNYQLYDVLLGQRAPYQYTFSAAQGERNSNNTTQIPRAANGSITIDGTLDAGWPIGPTLQLGAADRVLGIAKAGMQADYRLAWDDENLYVYADVTDDTPMVNPWTGWDIWNGDAVELFVGPQNVDQGGAIQLPDSQVIVAGANGAGGEPESHWYNNRADQPELRKAVVATDHGYALEFAIPLSALNITDAADGRQLRFDIGFDDAATSTRERQFLWNGVDGNASNRDKWGRATLVSAVAPAPSSVAVTGQSQVPVGQTVALAATVLPAAADQAVTWSSSDPTVATVDTNGVVTGVRRGTVVITATSTTATVAGTAVVEVLPAAWSSAQAYVAGDVVSYGGHVYTAQWWTQSQTPGDSPYGPWAEQGATVGCQAGSYTAWTASAIYTGGQVVAYQGHRWQAKWWTRDQTPGDPYGPWLDLGDC